jgi:hypothetical protein
VANAGIEGVAMSPISLFTRQSAISTAARSGASVLVAVGIAVATAGPAWADNLNVAGSWKMAQDNGYTVNLNISGQDPVTGHLTGTASTRGMTSNRVTGTVTDHSIDLNIPWDTGPIGDITRTGDRTYRHAGRPQTEIRVLHYARTPHRIRPK